MKYSTLFVAISVATLSVSALAAPRVSGRIKPIMLYEKIDTTYTNLETQKVTTRANDRPMLVGNSRIRFSGSEKLDDKLTLSYSMEYNVIIDSDSSNNWTPRSTYMGLEHKDYGRLRFGRLSMPGGDDVDINMSSAYSYGADEPFSYSGETRTDNAFQYASPRFGKDKKKRIKVHYGIDEGESGSASINTFNNENKRRSSVRRDAAMIDFVHSDKTFSYGAFYAQAGDDFKAVRGSVQYQTPDQKLGLGLMAQHTDYASDDNELGVMGSVGYYYKEGSMLYAQAGTAENFQGFKDGKKSVFSVGLNKTKKLASGNLLTYAAVSYEDLNQYRYAGSDDVNNGLADKRNQLIKVDSTALGLEAGLQYSF